MWAIFGILSFLGSVVFAVMAIISALKKKGKTRQKLLIAGGLFGLFLVLMVTDPSADDPASADSTPGAQTASAVATESPAASPSAEEVKAQEAELAAATAKQEEETKKAAEEAARKAAEEKQKAAEEAKRKAAEETAAKAEQEKQFMVNVMNAVASVMVESGELLSDASGRYLAENYKWFPARTAEDKLAARAAVSSGTTSRHLFKNIVPYQEKMVKLTGTIIKVEESETDFGTLASIHILDESGNSIMGIYPGSTGDLLDGDNVTLYGAPTIAYSFPNVGGGTTNAILLAVSNFTV